MRHEGLVFGKFYPFHRGHLALIDFALQHCDQLHVVVCAAESESISGEKRLEWIQAQYRLDDRVKAQLLPYDENELPNTSVSSRDVSRIWATKFQQILPGLTAVFTSEPYGDFLAEFMGIRHLAFDRIRNLVPVSATEIRERPLSNWEYLPPQVREHFVKRIAIVGTESTGKSVLAEVLAQHFNTLHVREMGREVIPFSSEARFEDLFEVVDAQIALIEATLPEANRVIFMDTGLPTTRSYARYLFGREMELSGEKEEGMRADLYLLLEPDAPYVQDGTRLEKQQRDALAEALEEELEGMYVVRVNGSWAEREAKAIAVVEEFLGRF